MNCPWCSTRLDPLALGPVTVDSCSRCGPQWFDRTELAAALNAELPGLAVDWGQPSERRDLAGWPTCPRDRAQLTAYQWLGAEFGRCERCRGVLISDANWAQLLGAARLKVDQSGRQVGAFALIEIVGEVLALFHH